MKRSEFVELVNELDSTTDKSVTEIVESINKELSKASMQRVCDILKILKDKLSEIKLNINNDAEWTEYAVEKLDDLKDVCILDAKYLIDRISELKDKNKAWNDLIDTLNELLIQIYKDNH